MQYKNDIDVELIQHMGSDGMVAAAAKVSTNGVEARSFVDGEANAGLINYLMKHRHGTPFEHGGLTMFVHAPIFVWREWHRHRIGFCLAEDTEIWCENHGSREGRSVHKKTIHDLWNHFNNGVEDNKGRVRHLPSIRNQKLRVLNEETGFFELGGIESIIQSGEKECVRVETLHKKGWSVDCSRDHQILTSEGWVKAGDLNGDELIAVSSMRSKSEGRQVPPALRSGIGVWTSMQRGLLIKLVDRCYVCSDLFNQDELILDHVVPVVKNLKLALDTDNLRPICKDCHKEKTADEQSLALRNNAAGIRFEYLKEKPKVIGDRMTYDISMKPPHHNFVANGIVVHNSYNEESGRYKQLEPCFYVPPRDRGMMKVEGWKPGRPKFLPCESEEVYQKLIGNLQGSYELGYAAYEHNLSLGIDPGLARDCLPVGIYSGCWVTCNPRSLMAFLSLRTHEAEAKFVSYPLYEIEVAARKVESIFASLWPLTYKAFCENGRVGP